MVGSLLAGTDESPGLIMTRGGHRYKASRGMASLGAKVVRKAREGEGWITQEEISDYVSEGVEAAVPYKGAVRDTLAQLTGGAPLRHELLRRPDHRGDAGEGGLCADDLGGPGRVHAPRRRGAVACVSGVI